jgi:hypothetical protein
LQKLRIIFLPCLREFQRPFLFNFIKMAETTLTMNDLKYLRDIMSHMLRESNKEVAAILQNQQHVSVFSPSKPSSVSSPKVLSRSHESKKSLVAKNPCAPASSPNTPISISQAPVTPAVRTTPTSISWLPSTPVVARCSFKIEICFA